MSSSWLDTLVLVFRKAARFCCCITLPDELDNCDEQANETTPLFQDKQHEQRRKPTSPIPIPTTRLPIRQMAPTYSYDQGRYIRRKQTLFLKHSWSSSDSDGSLQICYVFKGEGGQKSERKRGQTCRNITGTSLVGAKASAQREFIII